MTASEPLRVARQTSAWLHSTLLLATLALAACADAVEEASKNASPPPTPVPETPLFITGTVSAKGATLAMGKPAGIQRMWAWLFGNPVAAAVEGVDPAPSVTVNLYKIDSTGVISGGALATTTTNSSGVYS